MDRTSSAVWSSPPLEALPTNEEVGLEQQIRRLHPGDHLCLIYEDDPVEQLAALVPFLREGLAQDEQCIYVADDHSLEQLSSRLKERGIQVEPEVNAGRLKLWTRREWRQEGPLDSLTKSRQLKAYLAGAEAAGFKGVRFAIEMTWTLNPDIQADQVAHWEATINTLLGSDFPARMICQYSRARLAPEVILAALQTHPLVVLREGVYSNAFYEAPLILQGHRPPSGQSSGFLARQERANAAARVDWMLAQIRTLHEAETQRQELVEQRARVAASEAAQGRLTRVLESIADGFAVIDREGNFSYLNRAAEEMVRVPNAGLIGRHFLDAIPALRQTRFETEIRRALAENAPVEFEASLAQADRWFSVRGYPSSEGLTVYFREITVEKRAEANRRLAEQRVQQLLTLMPVAVYTCDARGRITFFNRRAAEIWGREPEMHQEDVKFCGALRLRQLDGSPLAFEETPMALAVTRQIRTRNREVVIERPDGARLFVSVNVDPIYDEEGRPQGAINVFEETTERKRMEEALRDSEERLRMMVENTPECVKIVDAQGQLVEMNAAGLRLTEAESADQVLGRSVYGLIAPEHRESFRLLNECVCRGQAAELEFQLVGLKGSRRWMQTHAVPLRNPQTGEFLHLALTRDVSPSKAAEQERLEGELQQQALYRLVARVNRAEDLSEIYAAALDAIQSCQKADRASILLFDSGGMMRFKAFRGLSEQYCRAVEGHSPWRREDPDPKPIWIDDVAAAELEEGLRQTVLQEGIGALAFVPIVLERHLLGKFMVYYNGPHSFQADELRPVETIASQIAFAIERQNAAEALERLVLERTESLRDVVAQMEEFSYSVSHDLRAPVRAMQGYSQAILEDYGARLDEEGRRMLGRIVRNASRMDRLIQDLLTYSRLSQRELRLERVELRKLIQDVIQHYPGMQSDRADIELIEPLPDLLAHEPSLAQAISNLLSNAVKFVPAGRRPQVRIWSELLGPEVRVWFEDNGIGITTEQRARLFQMFERVNPSDGFEGNGIGLAIVRRALERMSGSVGVESDGVSGSRFWIQMPIDCSPAEG